MSDAIKHECGLILLRLRKPLSYYKKKYGTALYGLEKLYLLMEKQRNRGQDGVGIATLKLDADLEYPYLQRARCNSSNQISDLFKTVFADIEDIRKYQPEMLNYPEALKWHSRFLGELILGHLRYGTQGRNNIEFCHPFVAYDMVPTKNIALAGNFNIVNVRELFEKVGVQPTELNAESDLAALLELFKYYIEKEVTGESATFDLLNILRQIAPLLDGGYHLGGILGNGDGFVLRDPMGIRPSYYHIDDEIIVAASERSALQTVFDLSINDIQELQPGHALITEKNGRVHNEQVITPSAKRACSFEQIYFSRGNDSSIYRNRVSLGYSLAPKVLQAINYDLDNTVFSFIPNTAEVAFYGLIKGVEDYLDNLKLKKIISWGEDPDQGQLEHLINFHPRVEKVVIKDVKMRTFITEDASRNEMVKHVYDVTYGIVRPGIDTLVIIDDSIVRGTTLRESIIQMMDSLRPKRIIILSSAPQIRYPDCYGIDMSKISDFIVFQAAVSLLREKGKECILTETYQLCLELEKKGMAGSQNALRSVYESLNTEEISSRVAELVTIDDIHAEVAVIFQSVDDLHKSCPQNTGDWYFTGNYPTPGGNRVVNKAFINYMENRNERGY